LTLSAYKEAKMYAIRVHEFGSPDVLRFEEVPDPGLAEGQVLVSVRAVGVNPVETYIRYGTYARRPALPYTPGMDGAGVVMQAARGVASVKAGDRVYITGAITGTYAEKALCLEAQVHKLPDTMDFGQGAALGVPYGTAFRALFQKARIRTGETVLVHGGSGGVGTACIQLARGAGCRVAASAGTKKGLDLVRELGAAPALDHTRPDYLDSLREFTKGRGADVVIEMRADLNLAKDLAILAPGGRVVIIGSRGSLPINPRDLMATEGMVFGVMLFLATAEELFEIHEGLAPGLRKGTLRPVIGKEFPLQDAAAAHKAIEASGAYGKIVLIP